MRALRYVSTFALVSLLGCSIGQPGSDSLGTSVGMTDDSDSESTGSGDGDGDPAGDGDGDPSGDGDGDPSGDGDGDPSGTGDGDGDPSGDGDGDGPSLTDDFRYAFSVQSGTWSKIPLTSIWDNPSAPLETEIVAATRLTHMPWLMLFGADGNVYEQHAGIWQEPESLEVRFPLLVDLDLAGLYHVPSLDSEDIEGLTFIDNPDAVIYDIFSNEMVVHNVSVVTEDEEPPGPPQASGRVLWFFEDTDPALFGQENWFTLWAGFNDGFMYSLNAAFVWSRFPIDNNAFFGTGDEDEPDPTMIRAAWYEKGPGGDDYLYMVGP